MNRNFRKILFGLAAFLVLLLIGVGVFLAVRPEPEAINLLPMWVGEFSPDGRKFLTAGGNQSSQFEPPKGGELVLWNLANGRKKRVLQQEATIRSLAWSPNGNFAAIGDWRGVTKLVNPVDGKIIIFMPAHPNLVNAVVVSKNGTRIACAGIDGVINVCDPAGKELATLQAPDDRLLGLAISPDGGQIAATSKTGKAYLFDVANPGAPIVMDAYHGRPMNEPRAETVAFAPDGNSFITGCQHTLRLWNSANGRLIREFGATPQPIAKLAISPDGETLATMESDSTLTLWNLVTGAQITSKVTHNGGCNWVGFSPNGQQLATVGRFDSTVRIWDANTLDLMHAFTAGKSTGKTP